MQTQLRTDDWELKTVVILDEETGHITNVSSNRGFLLRPDFPVRYAQSDAMLATAGASEPIT